MKTFIAAATLLVAGLTCVAANSLQSELSQFCAVRYQAPISKIKPSMVLDLYFSDGRVWHTRMTRTEWIDCYCKEQSCGCCEYDIAKACAYVAHRNATTNDSFRFSVCEARVDR